jgi:hypothetical protein
MYIKDESTAIRQEDNRYYSISMHFFAGGGPLWLVVSFYDVTYETRPANDSEKIRTQNDLLRRKDTKLNVKFK